LIGLHTTLGYSENSSNASGTLSVKDGAHIAKIALLGNYMAGSFVSAADGHGGTLITEAGQAANHDARTTIANDRRRLAGIVRRSGQRINRFDVLDVFVWGLRHLLVSITALISPSAIDGAVANPHIY
jgi:hypothetical protein